MQANSSKVQNRSEDNGAGALIWGQCASVCVCVWQCVHPVYKGQSTVCYNKFKQSHLVCSFVHIFVTNPSLRGAAHMTKLSVSSWFTHTHTHTTALCIKPTINCWIIQWREFQSSERSFCVDGKDNGSHGSGSLKRCDAAHRTNWLKVSRSLPKHLPVHYSNTASC